MNGTAVGQPGALTYRVTSACATPNASPANIVIGNEANRPTTAATRVGTTTKANALLLRVVIGTSRIAAAPPRAAPSAQLAIAIRSGEIASDPAATGFSATAEVSRPNRVNRYTNHSTVVNTTTIPRIHKRSSPTEAPNSDTGVVGNSEGTTLGVKPYISVIVCCTTSSSANVATTLIRFEANRRRRI